MGEILRIARQELRRLERERERADVWWEAQRDTLALMLHEGVGRSQSISNKDLRTRIGEGGRSSQWFQHKVLIPLRQRGAFLAWGSNGYYFPESDSDFKEAVASYVKRIRKEQDHKKALEAAWAGDVDAIADLFPEK